MVKTKKQVWPIIDSQSVKWGNNQAPNAINGNKKVKGIKRHVIVDKNGLLIAVLVTVANIHDSKAAKLLMQILMNLCSLVKIIIADGGYRGKLDENIYSGYKEEILKSCLQIDKEWYRGMQFDAQLLAKLGYQMYSDVIPKLFKAQLSIEKKLPKIVNYLFSIFVS